MKLNIKALSLTGGILLGAELFLTGIAHLLWPGYAAVFLGSFGMRFHGQNNMNTGL